MKAQNNLIVPLMQRKLITYPCQVHGDPRNPPPEVLLALWLFFKMPEKRLDVNTLQTLLKWLHIKKGWRLFYLELLEIIENALTQRSAQKSA